ncbi:MAG: efflux RND transporter permease subunit [Acidocella sp.]|uniref:efflux RND transporter permease subunit n=1 Tax=Acidocella sp. TaxID=50710 RepID=UPI003FC74366
MSRFFIDRPIFAWVLALVLMLAGGIEIFLMPKAQYPSIAAPQITISATYPGASAQTVADTVIRPILQHMNGLDGLEYISSTAESNGSMEVDLTFAQGTDANIAEVQVLNKLSLANPDLPPEVVQGGLNISKSAKSHFLIMGLVSTDRSMSSSDIADYIASHMQDPLTRISGIGSFNLLGSEYAMRIWIDPDKLYKYGLTATDVTSAIQAQNAEIPAGELGGLPSNVGQRIDATIIGPTRMRTPEEFEDILLKVEQSGAQVRLGDVARVELGPQSYSITGLYNGLPAAGLGLKLTPAANQLTTEAAVKAEIAVLSRSLPSGLKVVYPLDTEPDIIMSLTEVVKTLAAAIVLVFVVMLVFLQNIRATLIPTIAVPVVLLGTFAVLAIAGYTINTLTMLAMVLAVGLLVDDAIVVVENVERLMSEHGLSPREAARRSMDEISGALIGIGLVLSAVFLPMAFFGGATGVIYRQFSITIVSAMALSVLVALILTPALCATLLKPAAHHGHGAQGGFAGWFNRGFDAMRGRYLRGAGWMTARPRRAMLGFVLITVLTGALFACLPTGFLPSEDEGLMFGQVTLPADATAEQTAAFNHQVMSYLQSQYKDSIDSVFTATGFNFAGQAENQGLIVVHFKDWSQRPKASQSVAAVTHQAMLHFAGNRDGRVFFFSLPPVHDLGNADGFDLELENQGQLSHAAFLAARNQFLTMARHDPLLAYVRPNGLEDAPQYQLHIDREKAMALGVSVDDINTTVETALASDYVNLFMREGRVEQVYVQGTADARMLPSDVSRWYVRNAQGGMVPLDGFVDGSWTLGPEKAEIYNGVDSYEIQGSPAVGVSSGTAMAEVKRLVAELPPGVTMDWTNLSYEQVKAGSQTLALYVLSFIIVLLCLAALYESWPIPISVMLVVPLGVVGAIAAMLSRGLSNDVYFQVGLLTTMGLATKNAILIVEFAKAFFDGGMSLAEAVLHAARERLRPILMTSIAFVFGTLPLAIATGAGAASRTSIGTAVIGGMLSATVLAIFFVPVFFIVVLKLFKVAPRPAAAPATTAIGQEG